MDAATLLLAGDVMTGRGVDQALAQRSDPTLHEGWVRDAREYLRLAERANGPIERPVAVDYPWGDALQEIGYAAPDACIVNLETALTTASTPWPGKGIHYRMHPANVGVLQAGRVDVCALANNHVLDWGRAGLAETLHTLQRAGLGSAGAGADDTAAFAPATRPLGAGARLRVVSAATRSSGVPAEWAAAPARSGVALLPDLGEAGLARIAGALGGPRRAGEVVVLSLHWGANRVETVPESHVRFARRLLDERLVDVVHGHSAHHPLPLELHRGRLILYGCGDLINDYEGIEPRGSAGPDGGCLYLATLSPHDGRLLALRIVPLRRRRLRLERADAAQRRELAALLQHEPHRFATALQAQPDGSWRLALDVARS